MAESEYSLAVTTPVSEFSDHSYGVPDRSHGARSRSPSRGRRPHRSQPKRKRSKRPKTGKKRRRHRSPSSSTSGSRSPPRGADPHREDILLSIKEGLKEWLENTYALQPAGTTPPHTTRLEETTPAQRAFSPSGLGDSEDDVFDLHPSGEEMEGLSDSRRGRAPPTLQSPAPAATVTASQLPHQTEGQAGGASPEGSLFPQPAPIDPLPAPESVAQTLEFVHSLVPSALEPNQAAPPTEDSGRRLTQDAPAEGPSAQRFLLDGSLTKRLCHWARTPHKDLTSYSKDLDGAVRVRESDYQAFIKSPPIPEEVYSLLNQPQSGTTQASASDRGRAGRFKNPTVQAREENLRTIDRTARVLTKYQGLILWITEAIARSIEERNPTLEEELRPFFLTLTGLIDGSVDQVGRLLARTSMGRRENVFPLLGLSSATIADLRRLPTEGPDLFGGHFNDVLTRQADRLDTLRKTQKLVSKAKPSNPARSIPPSSLPATGRNRTPFRGRNRARRGGRRGSWDRSQSNNRTPGAPRAVNRPPRSEYRGGGRFRSRPPTGRV